MKQKLETFLILSKHILLAKFAAGILLFFVLGIAILLIGVFISGNFKYAFAFFGIWMGMGLIISFLITAGLAIEIGWHLSKAVDPTIYLNDNFYEFKQGVLRSSDNRRQLRNTYKDGFALEKGHFHLEALKVEPSSIVIESNVEGDTDWMLEAVSKIPRTCIVAKIDNLDTPLKVKHFLGLPPELTSNEDQRILLPQAQVLVMDLEANLPVIDEKASCVILNRFTQTGIYAGDTWHTSVAAAKSQALFEYGIPVDQWHPVPEGASDMIAFTLSLAG